MMNEADLVESATAYFELVADMLSLYLTATTGYLVAAYIIGYKLTRSQLFVISGLYLIFASVSTYLTIGYGLRGMSYALLIEQSNPDTEIFATNIVAIAISVFLVGGIVACFKFMWDIRHPKSG